MIKGTENIPVGDLISRRVPFVIPKYQRGYAWRKKDEIEDFIGDIETLFKLRLRHGEQMKKHFFGGLVSVDRFAANTATGRVFEVVDGQQRLATFLITMSLMEKALRGIAVQAKQGNDVETENSAQAHADQTRKSFLTYEEVDQGQLRERLRLRMSKVDHAYFENLLLTSIKHKPQPGNDSHRKIYDAYVAIEERLFLPIIGTISTLSPSEKLQHLLTMRTCITDDCHVIFIVSDDRYEAYHLFTTLNDRGKNLGNGDLLRSTTLEMLEGHQVIQDGVEMKWHEILSVKDTDVDKFLHAYFISFAGYHAPRKDLFDYFRKRFFDYQVIPPKLGVADSEAKSIEKRIESMQKLSSIYHKISNGEWPYPQNHSVADWDRDRLFRLIKILQHTLAIPLLLAIYDQLSEQEFIDTILMLERFVFRYITIAGAHESKVSEIYEKFIKIIRQDPSSFNLTEMQQEFRKLSTVNAPDAVFESNLITKLMYSDSAPQKRRIRHFLTTLEDHKNWFANGANGNPAPNKMIKWDLNQVTIEHIYPQKPKPQDINLKLEPHKHEIANLSFWAPSDNSKAGNDSFVDKLPRYQASTVHMNQELAKLNAWGIREFENRKAKLIKQAKKLFSV